MRPVRLIGLTGGIACGKSTVADMLRAHGVPVIDADVIARQLLEHGTEGLAAVKKRFPDAVLPNGTLDRARLGQKIFTDASEREALNAIVHPLVAAQVMVQAQALAAAGHPVAVYDVPLLFENGLERLVDGVLVVDAPPQVQKARLVARNGLSDAEAQSRIDSQWPLARKKALATWVIDNGGTLANTRAQVEGLWSQW